MPSFLVYPIILFMFPERYVLTKQRLGGLTLSPNTEPRQIERQLGLDLKPYPRVVVMDEINCQVVARAAQKSFRPYYSPLLFKAHRFLESEADGCNLFPYQIIFLRPQADRTTLTLTSLHESGHHYIDLQDNESLESMISRAQNPEYYLAQQCQVEGIATWISIMTAVRGRDRALRISAAGVHRKLMGLTHEQIQQGRDFNMEFIGQQCKDVRQTLREFENQEELAASQPLKASLYYLGYELVYLFFKRLPQDVSKAEVLKELIQNPPTTLSELIHFTSWPQPS